MPPYIKKLTLWIKRNQKERKRGGVEGKLGVKTR